MTRNRGGAPETWFVGSAGPLQTSHEGGMWGSVPVGRTRGWVGSPTEELED